MKPKDSLRSSAIDSCHASVPRISDRCMKDRGTARECLSDGDAHFHRAGDYQELVDEISALLGAPATLENRDFELIAFGAYDSEGDLDPSRPRPVRTRSILTRRSTYGGPHLVRGLRHHPRHRARPHPADPGGQRLPRADLSSGAP